MISGGIDTASLTLELLKKGYQVYGIMFNYGQINFKITYKKAKKFTEKHNIPLKVVKIPQDWIKSNVLNKNYVKEGCNDNNLYKQNIKELFWIPGRAILFWTLAASYAASLGIKEVYSAVQMDTRDWNTYDRLKDKTRFSNGEITPEFLSEMNHILKYSLKFPVVLKAPYMTSRKHAHDIALEGVRNGLDLNDTYSCRYYPECNECAQCLIRKNRIKYVEENL